MSAYHQAPWPNSECEAAMFLTSRLVAAVFIGAKTLMPGSKLAAEPAHQTPAFLSKRRPQNEIQRKCLGPCANTEPRRNRISNPREMERIDGVTNIRRTHQSFKSTSLWQAARARRFLELPYPAKRLARQIGCEPELAILIAELAGLGDGARL